jgi:cytidylate kinase
VSIGAVVAVAVDALGLLLCWKVALVWILRRTVALAAQGAELAWDDESRVAELAERIAERDGLRFVPDPGGPPRLHLDGRDVSTAIRSMDIAQGASRVSALPGVRAALLEMQRRGARAGGVVLEGRDIGTVVLPDAEAKVFLTASVDVRARRRFDELSARREGPSLAEVEKEVRERDTRDTTRPIAPLRQAEDALLVDSSDCTIEAVVDRIVAHVEARRGAAARGARG